MAKKPHERWEVRMALSQIVILIGVITGCLAISFYLGFFSGKKVGASAAMNSALLTLPKVPITGEVAAGENAGDTTEDAVSDVYAKLKSSGTQKGNSVVELPMPAVEAIKEADAVTKEGEKSLHDSLEAVEPPQPKEEVQKSQALSDPWGAEPQAPKKKTIDEVLNDSGAAPIHPSKEKEKEVAPTVVATIVPTIPPTAVPVKPTATAVPKNTPTPKATPTPAPTKAPVKTVGADISQGVKERGWYAQVAAPKTKSEADGLAGKLRSNGFRVSIETANIKGDDYYRILVGPEDNRGQAESLIQQLSRESYLTGAPFIRSIK